MPRFRGAALVAAPFFGLLIAVAQVPAPKIPTTSAPVAHPPAITPAAGVAVPSHPLDQADLTAFFDGILPLQLERSDIGGASVLVMKDGNILLQKGYGYADVKAKKPVDPASTIFRLASISKLFTWVSIMQLEEQGKLNLDTDVNQYLDFKSVPPSTNQSPCAT